MARCVSTRQPWPVWRHVIERNLRSGELVNPTGRVFKTGHGFYLLRSQSRRLSPAARNLHDWLLHEFREKEEPAG